MNEIELRGRYIERNGDALLSLRLDTARVADSLITWSASPAGKVEFIDSAGIYFLDSGKVTLTAIVGSDTVQGTFDIALPPLVIFDKTASGNRDIYGIRLDGLDSVRLTTDVAADLDPSVRADKITFLSYRGGRADLWRIGLGGGSATALTANTTEEGDPAAAPGGGALAFTELIGGLPKLYRTNGLTTVPMTGSFSDGAVDASPSWSPDGTRIAFVSSQNGPVRLWVANLGNGTLDTLPGHGTSGADVEPAWSPSGAFVAFATSRDGPTEIYVLRVADGSVVRITTAGGTNGQPAWTADERLVYTVFDSGTTHLRWVTPLVTLPAPAVLPPMPVHDIPNTTGAQHPAVPLP